MNCPACKTAVLEPAPLEENLTALACARCGGQWLAATDYEEWLALPKADSDAAETAAPTPEVTDTPQAKLCPLCKRILARYRVGHDLDFGLDHCGTCNGLWLDPGEWESLKAHGLHRMLQRIPTAPWQRDVRQAEHRKALQAFYTERFGESDYAEIRRIHTWLLQHPQREMMLAYLSTEDPYREK